MVINRFRPLLHLKEAREDRTISVPTIAKETGLSTSLLYAWMKQDGLSRFDGPVVEKLCTYLACGIGDLLKIR